MNNGRKMEYCRYFLTLFLCLHSFEYVQCHEPYSKPVKKIKRIPHLAKELDINEHYKAWVFDHLVSVKYNELLLKYLFYPPANPNLKNMFQNYTHSTDMQFSTARWSNLCDKNQFQNFRLWKTAEPLIEKALGKRIYLEKVQAKHIRSLDPNTLHRGECDEHRYNSVFFVVPTWQYNNYGQISLYSMLNSSSIKGGKSRFEVVHTIHPKPLRMVVWPSCVPFIEHPPTVNYYQYLTSFAITFTTKESLPKNSTVRRSSMDIVKKSFFDFKFKNVDADREIHHEKHLTRSFYDSSNSNGIFVFDDLFTHDELKQIKQYILERGVNNMAQFITAVDEDGDNVGVVSPFSVAGFVSCPLWKRVYDLVCHVSGETGWYPYDVALNHIHTSGHARIHSDAEDHQFEYTYLLYLNPDVGPDEFGETTWFERVSDERSDDIHKYTYPGGEEFESFVAVKPKYGRVVIFRNIIEHSARPLGSQHFGNRYSFAVKVSQSRRISLTKQGYETAENLDLNESEVALVENLIRGTYDEVTSQVSTEKLEEMLKEWGTRYETNARKLKEDFLSQLQ